MKRTAESQQSIGEDFESGSIFVFSLCDTIVISTMLSTDLIVRLLFCRYYLSCEYRFLLKIY